MLVYGEAAHPSEAVPKGGKSLTTCDFPDSWMEAPGDAPFMLSYDSVDLTGNRLALSVPESDWSAPFSLESMGTTGVLEARGAPSSDPSLKKARPLYELGLSFQLGAGHFSRSRVAYVVPRYTMVNRTGLTIQLVQSELASETNARLELPDGELQPFHWLDEKKARTVMMRVVPKIGTSETFHTGWGGPVKPEQVGTFALCLPPDAPSGEALHVCVEVRLCKAAAFVIFRMADPGRPMYCIANSSGKRIVVWQEGGSAVGAIGPSRNSTAHLEQILDP